MNREITIIGATSALGRNLVSLLAGSGYEVLATYRREDRVPRDWIGKPRIRLSKLDLTLPADFNEFKSSAVVWLAHLDQGRFNEHETRVNLEPLESFLKVCNTRVEKFVFVSSGGAVYGEPESLPVAEQYPRNPLSSYGKAKMAMEDLVVEVNQKSGLRTAIIRPGNIYGFEDPGRKNNGIIGAYLNSIRTGLPFTLIHQGRTVRDFIHVDDVGAAIHAAVESRQKNIVWNVGSGIGTSTADVLEMVLRCGAFQPPVTKHIENYSSDVGEIILSIDRIRSESEWWPTHDLESGIAETVTNWIKAVKDTD